MENKDLVEKLSNLAQLDIDASFAYEQALKNIDDDSIYKNIDNFRQDHLEHVSNLSKVINEYGGNPPKREKDFKGFLIEGFTSLRSITGTKGALKAMETNEELTNKTYKIALAEDSLPKDVRSLIEKNYDDEKRHLKYIRDTLHSYEE